MLRSWQRALAGITLEDLEGFEEIAPEDPDSHDHLEDYEIVEPPEEGEDQEQNHGGDDSCQDVEDAPEREEAQGEAEEGQTQSEPQEEPENENEEESDIEGEYEEEDDDEEEEDYENEDEYEEDEDDNEDMEDGGEDKEDEKKYAGVRNHQQTFTLEGARRKRLATAFSVIVSKIAEDLSGWPTEGDDEWDIQAIMERRITKRPLSACRQSREKESIVVILDTSGSCRPQAEFYASIARIALANGDVELYDAPNGRIQAWNRGKGWQYTDDCRWNFKGRTIIFFGDFDGGDFPVEASWRNKIYWFSSEGDRYSDMDEHDWCHYTLDDFKGKYYDCLDEDDFMRLVKKIR